MFHSMIESYASILPNFVGLSRPVATPLTTPVKQAQKAASPTAHPFRLAKTGWHHGRDTVRLHPEDLARLEAIDGDTFHLCGGAEPILIKVTPSRTVRQGQLMVPESLRCRLKAGRLGRVTLQPVGVNGS